MPGSDDGFPADGDRRENSDATLLRAWVQHGQRPAFDELAGRYQEAITRWSQQIVGNRTDAEAVAAEVLSVFAERAHSISGQVDAWLRSVTLNRARNWVRDAATRRRYESRKVGSPPLAEQDERDLDGLAIVDASLQELSSEQRLLIHRLVVEGASKLSLARELGVSRMTIARRLQQALANLRAGVVERGGVWSVASLPLAFTAESSSSPASSLAAAGASKAIGTGSMVALKAAAALLASGLLVTAVVALAGDADPIVEPQPIPMIPAPAAELAVLPIPSAQHPLLIHPSAGGSPRLVLAWSDVPQPARLRLRVHGLDHRDDARIDWDGAGSVSLRHGQPGVSVSAQTAELGGIGGVLHTHDLFVTPPAELLASKEIHLQLLSPGRGPAPGFRLVALELQDADGEPLPAAIATLPDPERPVLPPGVAARGRLLWTAGIGHDPGSGQALVVSCGECHSHDGRDLIYFAYDDHSISSRLRSYGLDLTQTADLLAYLRSLPVASPGRPQDPPYQPGPLVHDDDPPRWSAGAGVQWSLYADQELAPHLPGNVDQVTGDTGRFAAVPLHRWPINLQLPDWNGWLPRIHPRQVLGSAFDRHAAVQVYQTMRTALESSRADAKSRALYLRDQWPADLHAFRQACVDSGPDAAPALRQAIGHVDPALDAPEAAAARIAALQWSAVKLWELIHEFDLAAYGQHWYGLQAEPLLVPTARHICEVGNVKGQGSRVHRYADAPQATVVGNTLDAAYRRLSWLHVGMLFNGSARRSAQSGHHAHDWAAHQHRLGRLDEAAHPFARLGLTLKSLEVLDNGLPPMPGSRFGWDSWQGHPEWGGLLAVDGFADERWPAHDRAQIRDRLRPVYHAWLRRVADHAIADHHAAARASASIPDPDYQWSGRARVPHQINHPAERMRASLQRLRHALQVEAEWLHAYAAHAALRYPANDWQTLLPALAADLELPAAPVARAVPLGIALSWTQLPGRKVSVWRQAEGEAGWQMRGFSQAGLQFRDWPITDSRRYRYRLATVDGQRLGQPGAASAWLHPGQGLALNLDLRSLPDADIADRSGLAATVRYMDWLQPRAAEPHVVAGPGHYSALRLDGSFAFLSTTEALGPWLDEAWTIIAEIRVEPAHAKTAGLLGSRRGPGGAAVELFGFDADGYMTAIVGTEFLSQPARTTIPLADGRWHQVALTRHRDGRLQWTVDGQPAGGRQQRAGRLLWRCSSIGRVERLAVQSRRPVGHWRGDLARLVIVPAALSGADIDAVLRQASVGSP